MIAKTPIAADKQINLLCSTLKQAQTSFDLWEGLQEAKPVQANVDAMNRFAEFFIGIEDALFDSYTILLYQVLETRHDTITIPWLYRTVKSKLSEEQIRKYELDESKLRTIWKKIAKLRNEYVAHQSLDHDPKETFASANVTPEEIETLIKGAQTLLGKLSAWSTSHDIYFKVSSKPAVERLIKLLVDIKREVEPK